MTKRRMIHDCIWQSEGFAALTYRQRCLWVGIITTADDQGRARAHPGLVRAAVFPFDVIALDEIEVDLQALVDGEMLLLYQADGKALYQVLNWWEYQRPQWVGPSDYAPPEGWLDRLRYHGKGHKVITENWPESDKKASDDKADKPALKSALAEEEEEVKEEVEVKDSISSASADYQAIRQLWTELFPGKSKPRATNKTLQGKVKTRMKSEHFKANWRAALEQAAASDWLRSESFFDLGWFLKNDANYENCLNGKYGDRGKQADAPRPPLVKKRVKVWDKATKSWVEREAIA